MVDRIYVEKKPDLAVEAQALAAELRQYAGLDGLVSLRIVNRYDVQGLTADAFDLAVRTVFSEPQTDIVSRELTLAADEHRFALEYLPGQYDQRADAAAQCIQMQTLGARPKVRTAKVYVLCGKLTAADIAAAKGYLLNPVESREASEALPATLDARVPEPEKTPVLQGFRDVDGEAAQRFCREYQLAMEADDLAVCVRYFRAEGRDPTLAELKVIDTYWSDHCRHTTFLTELTNVRCDDPAIRATLNQFNDHREALGGKPLTLMRVATQAAKVLEERGGLKRREDSEENNACTLRVKANAPGGEEDWLLFFKNETHNHPTEIEPFGGAATCLGGAIRDPLSARGYVYAGMRVTGGADPTMPVEDTLPGKLPQRSIAQGAAAGFSSYGNQIGVPTGMVREVYHPGYVAKRLEAGAVLGAAKADHVRRERPAPGDVILLVGGRTGRDGCGGATGSSQAHTVDAVDEFASQVQKGNAPEERKLQRLFRDPAATRLIKRCNDFGAGGVSVAIGELAPGLLINLDKVPVKYQGLTGTELAISESQERMAVVVDKADVAAFIALAEGENVEATAVAEVTASPRLVMTWQGDTIVDLARAFLDENGAKKRMDAEIAPSRPWHAAIPGTFTEGMMALASDLNACSQRGLVERFDATVGAGTVLMPLGGKHQMTPPAAMVHALPVPGGTGPCSFMAPGFNPMISEQSPYHGAYLAVIESVASLVAAGAPHEDIYLSMQEFFPRPGRDPVRWGMPLAALLGAYRAQMDLKCGAIGGKDSMSGTFEQLDVPPTLISFAVTTGEAGHAVSPEFKQPGRRVAWLKPDIGPDGLPVAASQLAVFAQAEALLKSGRAVSCGVPAQGGAALACVQMALGNGIGLAFADDVALEDLFQYAYGSLILEMADDDGAGVTLGYTTADPALTLGGETVLLSDFRQAYDARLEPVYPVRKGGPAADVPMVTVRRAAAKGPRIAKPRVLIPAFPGTNCEWDTARAFEEAGAETEIFLVRNLSPGMVAESVHGMAERVKKAQIVMIPGGFSGGDEPDGSGRFIMAFFRAAPVRDAVEELLGARDGLLGGICNGFQALLKLGLLPFGRYMAPDADSPTLSMNTIGRHQSRLVRVRASANFSPWFSGHKIGDCYTVPISHGEGRFLCRRELLDALAASGQIAMQYADLDGKPTMDIDFNPSGSAWAVEALTSPDGRVMGRMGHAERMLDHLYQNVPHGGRDPMFRAAVGYFG